MFKQIKNLFKKTPIGAPKYEIVKENDEYKVELHGRQQEVTLGNMVDHPILMNYVERKTNTWYYADKKSALDILNNSEIVYKQYGPMKAIQIMTRFASPHHKLSTVNKIFDDSITVELLFDDAITDVLTLMYGDDTEKTFVMLKC